MKEARWLLTVGQFSLCFECEDDGEMSPVVAHHHGIAQDLPQLGHHLIFYRYRSNVLTTGGDDQLLYGTSQNYNKIIVVHSALV